METLTTIANRHSSRSFKSDALPRPVVEKIIDAGRLAATARNDQPWEFVVVTDPAMRKKIAALAEHGRFIADAPVCVVVLCKPTDYYLEDGSAASQNMLVAAADLGVASCWVAGDKRPYAQMVVEMVGAPRDHKLVSLLAMGRENMPEERKSKRPLHSVLHWEKY